MKRFVFFFTILFSIVVHAQRTDFQKSQFNKPLTLAGYTTPNLSDYPYLAITVRIRNERLLSDKEFLGNFIKMNYFYTEVSIGVNGKLPQNCPLYLLKREKGKFSVNIKKDMTVAAKIPYSLHSPTIPAVTINTNIEIENKAIKVIKYLSSKLGDIIKEPTSFYGSGGVSKVFGFVNEAVQNLSDKKQISLSTNFDAFPPDARYIKVHSFDIVILRPGNVPDIPANEFSVKKNVDSYDLYLRDTLYQTYPYFLIEKGVSNYVSYSGLPSDYYKLHLCDIDVAAIETMQTTLFSRINDLSQDQYATEEHLIKLYTFLSKIKTGREMQVGGALENPEIIINAYDSYYNFDDDFNKTMPFNEILLQDIFSVIYSKVSSCISYDAEKLLFFDIINPILPILRRNYTTYNNEDLKKLNNFISFTINNSIINKTEVFSLVKEKLNFSEKNIYNDNFSTLVNSMVKREVMSDDFTNDMTKLVALKNAYSNCQICQVESQKAEEKYNKIINTDPIRRNSILNVVNNSNTIILLSSLSSQKLRFLQDKLDPETKQPINLPIDENVFKSKIDNLTALKNQLNEKLALQEFNMNTKADVDVLINNCNSLINDLQNIISNGLNPFFQKYDILLSGEK